jgi:hypothetical protein
MDRIEIDNGQVFMDKENKVNDYLWNPDFNPVPKDLRKWEHLHLPVCGLQWPL